MNGLFCLLLFSYFIKYLITAITIFIVNINRSQLSYECNFIYRYSTRRSWDSNPYRIVVESFNKYSKTVLFSWTIGKRMGWYMNPFLAFKDS